MSDEYTDAFMEELHALLVSPPPPERFNNCVGQCRYNYAVVCDNFSRCRVCGWNPEVDKARRPKTRERVLNERKK